MSKQNKPDEDRRQLLKNIGLGVAVGAIANGCVNHCECVC